MFIKPTNPHQTTTKLKCTLNKVLCRKKEFKDVYRYQVNSGMK